MSRLPRTGILALALLASAAMSACSGGLGPAGRPGLAYVTGRAQTTPEVWLADLDGTNRHRLGTGTNPLLSPDGSLVAASLPAFGSSALVLYSGTGDAPRQYFDAAKVTARAQAWSKDSRYLAVVLSSTDPVKDAESGLVVIDASSGRASTVARGEIYGASFAPDGSDRIAYARAQTSALSAFVDIYISGPDGNRTVQATYGGRSLNPLWGSGVIAFDRERLRIGDAPTFQVWLMAPDGSNPRQLTHVQVPTLLSGLVPRTFSDDASRLLAEYEGQNTSEAWTIVVSTGRASKLEVGGHSVAGGGLSHTGATLLADQGGFLQPPDAGNVQAIPFTGGPARVLVAGASQPSWNE